MTYNKGNGAAVKWLRDRATYNGDGCLIFPFSRNPQKGYGMFGNNGELLYAHRFMCELANGPPPTRKHQTLHSCGNGHGGCVHPQHLSWGTNSDNQRDRWQRQRQIAQ
jgi:hypothetical protein